MVVCALGFGVRLEDLPDVALLHILRHVDYTPQLAESLLRLNRRMHSGMLSGREFPRFVVGRFLACAANAPFSAPEFELNVDRILDVMQPRSRLMSALRRTILGVAASPEDPLHDALLVRAPLLTRESHGTSDRAEDASKLLALLRPSVVRTITSESVDGRYLYRNLSEAEMQTLVMSIGRSPLSNRYVEASQGDAALWREIATYVRESRVPLEQRSVLRERGPLCFWDTSGVEDLRRVFDATRGDLHTQGLVAMFSSDLMWPTQNVVAMQHAFAGSIFNGRIGHLNVARVRNMDGIFSGNRVFDQPIGAWNVAQVTSMSSAFDGALTFDRPLATWNVGNVRSMREMFRRASNFNHPIESWNVGRVVNMHLTFDGAAAFNQPLGKWDVSGVRGMSRMFCHAAAFNQPLDNWVVSSVNDMHGMFWGAASFNQPLNRWDVSGVKDMGRMFWGAVSFDQPIGEWDVSGVTNMSYMFCGAASFNQPLDKWDVSHVTNMSRMFKHALKFNVPLGTWSVGNVTDMHQMFKRAIAFNRMLPSWDIRRVTSMHQMFKGARSLQTAPSWDIAHVWHRDGMLLGTLAG
jgi:surface protein